MCYVRLKRQKPSGVTDLRSVAGLQTGQTGCRISINWWTEWSLLICSLHVLRKHLQKSSSGRNTQKDWYFILRLCLHTRTKRKSCPPVAKCLLTLFYINFINYILCTFLCWQPLFFLFRQSTVFLFSPHPCTALSFFILHPFSFFHT